MKKKILFVIPEYSHGGTNKSLESLLSAIDEKRYEISIFCLYEDGGVYYKNIFKPYIIAKSLLYVLAHDNVITRKVMGVAMKLFKNLSFNWLYRYEANRLQHKYKFDTVIAFQEGSATQFVSLINYPVNSSYHVSSMNVYILTYCASHGNLLRYLLSLYVSLALTI